LKAKASVSISLVLILLLALCLASCGDKGQSPVNGDNEIIVSAAMSLKGALDEIASLFEARCGISIKANYAASGTLQHQIENGAPVDVYISAGQKQMNDLERNSLIIPDTRKNIISNTMVLITPAKDPICIKNFSDLTDPRIKNISIGVPEVVPAGKYAREILVNLNIWDQLQPKIVFAKDVRQVLHYVKSGSVDAGIVYASDAVSCEDVLVVAEAEDSLHSKIIYPAAVVKTSNNPEDAAVFIDFLLSSEAASVFANHGYKPIQK